MIGYLFAIGGLIAVAIGILLIYQHVIVQLQRAVGQ